jgi:hypothetical protein
MLELQLKMLMIESLNTTLLFMEPSTRLKQLIGCFFIRFHANVIAK